jgi:cysteine desulfurase
LSKGPSHLGTWDQLRPSPRRQHHEHLFDQLEGEALVIALDLKGVSVSGGSACHSGATEPSHVLMAMGLDKNRARASLRFSLLKTATDADVDHVLRSSPRGRRTFTRAIARSAGTLG